MSYVYPAIFYKEDNGYSVIFPDLNDLATCGADLSEAISMAEDALGLWLFTSLREGEVIPNPTPLSNVIKEEEDAFVNLIHVDMNDYAKKYSDKPVKKTLTIPTWLNTLGEENNINFSKILQEALLSKFQMK